jgi:hypothetical protein
MPDNKTEEIVPRSFLYIKPVSKEAEKTVRTHRLIIKGAELEAVFLDTKDMTKKHHLKKN